MPLYDYPHLIKCVRNHFLTKDILFKTGENQRRASWKHIIQLYEMDIGRMVSRVCSKLTDYHVYPAKIRKMNVKCCTQALSKSVGVMMGFLAENGKLLL